MPIFVSSFFFLMSGNVHPNPGLIFSCSVHAGNVAWWGRPVQCCTCSKWVHLRCSPLFLSKFGTLGSSHSWSFPTCCIPACNTVTSSLDCSELYTCSVKPGTPLLMQHSRPTLAFKFLIFLLLILSLLPHHRLLLLAVPLCPLLPLPP